MMHLLPLIVVSGVAASVLSRTGPDPDRYTVCMPDRGYEKPDQLEAANYLLSNISATTGLHMNQGTCVYRRHNTTVVSFCNGEARNRTVNLDEVTRGIEQLIKDCGADGGFSGFHVVNNLTFAAYGVLAGVNLAVPQGSPPPNIPGGSGRRHVKIRDADCAIDFKGTLHKDCSRKPGHDLNPDGSCGKPDPSNKCAVYCEQTRSGWLGMEHRAPGHFGDQQSPGVPLALTTGSEVSISTGFSIGVDGGLESETAKAIGAGVTFEYSIETTDIHTQERSAEASPIYYGRWVFFPKLVETCGVLSTQTYVAAEGCGHRDCTPAKEHCSGNIQTKQTCSLAPYVEDGNAQEWWAWRYENADETAVPMDEQSPSYKTICTKDSGKTHEGQWACQEGKPATNPRSLFFF